MSRYEEYITCLCLNRNCTREYAEDLALSREVKKYYEQEGDREVVSSTNTPLGECK